MPKSQPVLNICTYTVKKGKQAQFEKLLAVHWPALRKAGLATADKPEIYRGLPSGKPGERHGADRVYVEIFSWNDASAPGRAHQMPEVMAVWEPMGAICEQMDFPSFERFKPNAAKR